MSASVTALRPAPARLPSDAALRRTENAAALLRADCRALARVELVQALETLDALQRPPARCPECGGTGFDEDARCESCDGTGMEGGARD